MRFPARTCFALHLLVAVSDISSPGASVVIDAGPWDRTETLASFPFEDHGHRWHLRAEDDSIRPLQFDGGRAWFVEPHLPRNSHRSYILQQALEPATRCDAVRDATQVVLRIDGRPVCTYFAGPGTLPRPDIPAAFQRGGYFHPVLTPAGRVVTDDYPTNHLHHHGLWWSWTRTSFEGRSPDFWNMGESKGRTDFEALEDVESGPVFAGFRSRHVYTDPLAQPPRQALRETWTVRLLALGGPNRFRAFDLLSSQRCATESALLLPKYHYGGFAFRGRGEWNGSNHVRYLDANGVTDRVAANETRPRWFWMGGPVEGGAIAGLAILSHPENFRSPQPVRVHPTEPYACWTPSQLGDWAIKPGETYSSRYRVVVFDGDPEPGLLDRLWTDFAQPPVVRIE